MKRWIALLTSAMLILSCTACQKKEQLPKVEPQISQMRSICELAVMECYYHNVAKYQEEDAAGFLLWKKDKHFWIEYSGVVELGIDASRLSMEVSGDEVTITIPAAKVLSCTVDSTSLTAGSFIVDKRSANIDAEDEQAAFAEAQHNMEMSAASNRVLLGNAQQRVQVLLQSYVENIGQAIGKEYTIRWNFLEEDGTVLDADSAAGSGSVQS
ncbi:DUF4230 domain-containing protein [Oscillospiraceae bacterium 50-16]